MKVKKKFHSAIKKCTCFLLLGPPMALLYFARGFAGIVLTDLIVYRTCLITLNINITKCFMLGSNDESLESIDLETKVEPHAGMIVMVKTLVESTLPAVASSVLGPWSDQGGRKPLLLAAFSGFALQYLMLLSMSNWQTSPWYLLFAIIPSSILGGTSIARLASHCYIFDTTTENNRIVQLALVEVSIRSGYLLGGFAGNLIHKNYGYSIIFATSAACCISAIIYTYFCIPKKIGDTSEESRPRIFQLSSIKHFITCFTSNKPKTFHRSIICLAVFTVGLNITIYNADVHTIEFLFTRTRLGWNIQQYTYLITVDSVLRILSLCGVLLRKHFQVIPDMFIAGIGIAGTLVSAAIKSLTWKSWHMYFSVCFGSLNEIVAPIIRTALSKVVPSQDIGKVFTLAALAEMLGTLAGTPLYTLIYSNYLPPIYPSPVYLLSTCLFILLLLCVSRMEILIRKSQKLPKSDLTVETHL